MFGKKLCAAALVLAPGAHAGSLEFSTSDLTSGRSLDNIKGSWGTSFALAGQDLKLDAAYDMKANRDFLKEATVSGAFDEVGYALTHNFASGASKLALTTKQMGAQFKAVLAGSKVLSTVSAKKSLSVADCAVSIEPEVNVADSSAKVKATASYALGAGAAINGELTSTNDGDVSTAFDISYSGEIDGRKVKAVVKPREQEAELTVVDSAIGVATATYAVGGEPSLKLKRSVSF